MSYNNLQDRLKHCARVVGSQKDLAARASLSRSQLVRYLDGENSPPISKLFQISEASGIDLGWIVTGKGEPTSCNTPEQTLYADYDALSQVIKIFEEVLMEYPIQALTPSQKSLVLPLIYAESMNKRKLGHSPKISEQEIFDIMNFTSPLILSNSLKFFKESVLQMFQSNGELEADLTVNNFVNTVNNASIKYFDSPVNDYFERTKNTLDIHAKRSYMKVMETLFTVVKEPKIKMLDIGCGSGRYLLHVQDAYERIEVKGIDSSKTSLDICHTYEKTGKLPEGTVCEGNALEIPFRDEEFHFLTSQAVMHWIPFFKDRHFGAHAAFAEANRVLKKGGAFYVDMVLGNGEQSLVPFTQTYSKEMIQELANKQGFKVLWIHTNDDPHCDELIDHRKAGHPKFRNFIKAFLIKT